MTREKIQLFIIGSCLSLLLAAFVALPKQTNAATVNFGGFTSCGGGSGSECTPGDQSGCGPFTAQANGTGTQVLQQSSGNNLFYVVGSGAFSSSMTFASAPSVGSGLYGGLTNLPDGADPTRVNYNCTNSGIFSQTNILPMPGYNNGYDWSVPGVPDTDTCSMTIELDSCGSSSTGSCDGTSANPCFVQMCGVGPVCSAQSQYPDGSWVQPGDANSCGAASDCGTNLSITATPLNGQPLTQNGRVNYTVTITNSGPANGASFNILCPAGTYCRLYELDGTTYLPNCPGGSEQPGNCANTAGTNQLVGYQNLTGQKSYILGVEDMWDAIPSNNTNYPITITANAGYVSPCYGPTCSANATVNYMDIIPPCRNFIVGGPARITCENETPTSYRIRWTPGTWNGLAGQGIPTVTRIRVATTTPSGASIINTGCGSGPCTFFLNNESFDKYFIDVTNLRPGTQYSNRVVQMCTDSSGGNIMYKDDPDQVIGWGGNPSDWTCSTLPCNPVTYNSSNSGVSSSSSGPPTNTLNTTVGSTYYAFCDFGVNSSSISPPSGCAWVPAEFPANVSGTRYRFTCSQGSAGTFTTTCQNGNNAPQYYCADSRDVATVTVTGGVCVPNSTEACASTDGSTCTGIRTCNGTGTAWGACSYASTNGNVCDDNNACSTAGTSTCNNAGSCQTGTAAGSHCDTVSNLCVANTTASCSGTSCTSNAECALPVNGVCGNASGKIYPNGASGYAPDVQCSAGTSSNTAFPTAGNSVNWNCNGQNGGTNASCSASQALPGAPVVDIKCNAADSCTIVSGNSASLTWTSTNATSCTVTPGNYTGTSNIVGQSTGALAANTTYTINCTGLGGSGSDATTVTVTAAPDFSITHSPASQTITQGSNTSFTVTLTSLNGFSGAVNFASVANCPNDASCTFSPTNPVVPNGGSISTTLIVTSQVSAATGNFTLGVTATDQASGSLSHTTNPLLTVNTLGVAPTLTLTASPNPVDYNTPTTLTWSTTGTAPITCNSTAGTWTGSNPRAASGNVPSANLTADTTFTMQCTNAFGGPDTKSVTVNVRPPTPSGGGGGGGSVCNQISITWTAIGASVDGYRVYRNSSNNFSTATNISGNLTNGTTANSYIDTTAAPSNNYYWVVSYKGALESSPGNVTGTPLGATSCNADITANKDITKVNGTAPGTYTPDAYNTNDTPSNVSYNKFDKVSFSVNFPNQAPTGGNTATNVLVTDRLINLRKPTTGGWNMKIGATTLVEETEGGSYCTGTNYTTLAINHFVACGTAPNQTLYMRLNNIAQGGIISVTYDAEIYVVTNQTSSRFQNSAQADYSINGTGGTAQAFTSTPLIVFSVSNAPNKFETAP